jgi:hypothetical protein
LAGSHRHRLNQKGKTTTNSLSLSTAHLGALALSTPLCKSFKRKSRPIPIPSCPASLPSTSRPPTIEYRRRRLYIESTTTSTFPAQTTSFRFCEKNPFSPLVVTVSRTARNAPFSLRLHHNTTSIASNPPQNFARVYQRHLQTLSSVRTAGDGIQNPVGSVRVITAYVSPCSTRVASAAIDCSFLNKGLKLTLNLYTSSYCLYWDAHRSCPRLLLTFRSLRPFSVASLAPPPPVGDLHHGRSK